MMLRMDRRIAIAIEIAFTSTREREAVSMDRRLDTVRGVDEAVGGALFDGDVFGVTDVILMRRDERDQRDVDGGLENCDDAEFGRRE
jgi:hypothetical protein